MPSKNTHNNYNYQIKKESGGGLTLESIYNKETVEEEIISEEIKAEDIKDEKSDTFFDWDEQ